MNNKHINKYRLAGFNAFVGQYSRDNELKMDRSKTIGSSDIGSIMGVNPYCSAYRLFYEKLGLVASDFTEKAKKKMAIGKMMEDFILCAYLDTVEVASSDDFKRDERITKGNFTAQADAIINGVILEIKNIANFYAPFYNEQGDLTIPAYYRYQMYWQMYLFGLKHAKLVVFNNKEQEIYTFDLDYPPCETIDNMIKEANHFLEALRVQNVNMLRPENVDDYALITPSEDNLANRLSYVPVKQFYDDLMVLTVQIKELETKADECRKQLKLYMQDRPVLYDETKERPMVSWKAVTSNRLDTSRLKEELPEVYNNFLKATTTRVFKMHVTPVDD